MFRVITMINVKLFYVHLGATQNYFAFWGGKTRKRLKTLDIEYYCKKKLNS